MDILYESLPLENNSDYVAALFNFDYFLNHRVLAHNLWLWIRCYSVSEM